MTARACITRFDGLKYNTYSQEEKLEWLDRIEAAIQREIVDTHDNPISAFGEGLDRELLAPSPWDDLYLKWLEAQVDYYNGETARYNNSITMFHAAYDDFARWYNRTHMPKGAGRGFRF